MDRSMTPPEKRVPLIIIVIEVLALVGFVVVIVRALMKE